MANKNPLALWLYSNRDELSPHFREFSWPDIILPGLFDFATIIQVDGFEAEGRGVDTNREIALEKSVAEAIERSIWFHGNVDKTKFQSEGFAVTGGRDPEPHAQFEALERYFFHDQIRKQKAFLKLEVSTALAEKFKVLNPKADVSFHRMNSPENIFGMICVITSDEGKRSIGFALSEDLDHSAHRAFLEATTNYAWLTLRDQEPGASSEKLPWHIDIDFLAGLEKLLFAQSSSFEVVELPKLERSEIPRPETPFFRSELIKTARFIIPNLKAAL